MKISKWVSPQIKSCNFEVVHCILELCKSLILSSAVEKMCQVTKVWVLIAHLGVLSTASRRLHWVGSLDNLLRCGGGLVRGVVRALLHHVLTLLALRCGRARMFTQDWWAGGRVLIRVTGSAETREKASDDKTIDLFHFCWNITQQTWKQKVDLKITWNWTNQTHLHV